MRNMMIGISTLRVLLNTREGFKQLLGWIEKDMENSKIKDLQKPEFNFKDHKTRWL